MVNDMNTIYERIDRFKDMSRYISSIIPSPNIRSVAFEGGWDNSPIRENFISKAVLTESAKELLNVCNSEDSAERAKALGCKEIVADAWFDFILEKKTFREAVNKIGKINNRRVSDTLENLLLFACLIKVFLDEKYTFWTTAYRDKYDERGDYHGMGVSNYERSSLELYMGVYSPFIELKSDGKLGELIIEYNWEHMPDYARNYLYPEYKEKLEKKKLEEQKKEAEKTSGYGFDDAYILEYESDYSVTLRGTRNGSLTELDVWDENIENIVLNGGRERPYENIRKVTIHDKISYLDISALGHGLDIVYKGTAEQWNQVRKWGKFPVNVFINGVKVVDMIPLNESNIEGKYV